MSDSVRRILLVEDDDDQRFTLGELLRLQGYDVTEAGDAESALAQLRHSTFDLLVSDYQLGDGTGTWLARYAAESPRQPPAGVLLVTGHDVVPDAGTLRVLRKPLNMQRFLSEVEQALSFDAVTGETPPSNARRITFVMYVNGSNRSRRALRKVRALFEEYDAAQLTWSTIDVSSDTASRVEQDRIVVTPTLLKTYPPPAVWITGELENTDVVRVLLEQVGVERRA